MRSNRIDWAARISPSGTGALAAKSMSRAYPVDHCDEVGPNRIDASSRANLGMEVNGARCRPDDPRRHLRRPGPIRVKHLQGAHCRKSRQPQASFIESAQMISASTTSPNAAPGGRRHCCAALDAFSRRIARWSIDSRADSTLVLSALDAATRNCRRGASGVVHVDHEKYFPTADSEIMCALPGSCRRRGRPVTVWTTSWWKARRVQN